MFKSFRHYNDLVIHFIEDTVHMPPRVASGKPHTRTRFGSLVAYLSVSSFPHQPSAMGRCVWCGKVWEIDKGSSYEFSEKPFKKMKVVKKKIEFVKENGKEGK